MPYILFCQSYAYIFKACLMIGNDLLKIIDEDNKCSVILLSD